MTHYSLYCTSADTEGQARRGNGRTSQTELVHIFPFSLLQCEELKQQNKIPEYIKKKQENITQQPPSSAQQYHNVKQIRTKPCEIEISLFRHQPWN